jgi:isoquinoline 1-oxidoreductase subunit beta
MINSISERTTVSRRNFIIASVAAGGGLAIGLPMPDLRAALRLRKPATDSNEIGAWVVIKPNDDVIVRIARSEMGQGSLTGLAQLVAEELECDWKQVKTEYPTPNQNLARNRVWGDMATGGSRGIRGSQDYVRKGGAAARMMLIQAAANMWNVPASECKSEAGIITHTLTGRKTSYGKVAAAAAKLEVPKEVRLKDPRNWKIAGKPMRRLDTLDKLTGKQIYGIDLTLPGMLNAAIIDSPVFGNKVGSYDEAKVKAMPGVRYVVKVGETAVAVVADTWWQAKKGVDALDITWQETANNKVSSASIAEFLKEGLESNDGIFIGNQVGDAAGAIAGAAKTVEAIYATPYLHHFTMEPMNATAKWSADKCEVWAPTQNSEASLAAAAEAAGLPPSKCDVHKVQLGGGFGRRGLQDYVTKAVNIAKQIPDVPIKLIWSREEDMRQGRYRPVTQCRLSAGLDDKGNIVGLHMRISGQSVLAGTFPARLENGRDPIQFQGLNPQGQEGRFGYSLPNLLIDHAMRNTHVPPGFWRGVNHNQNAFYLECFIDELAKAAGEDPLEFRRKMLGNSRKHLAVLNAVAEKIGWGTQPPAGIFRGIAQMMGNGSYVAAAAEVSVESRKVKIHRLVVATDCGVSVNPNQIEAQVQGTVAFGLSASLYQECTVKDGRIVEENLDAYEVMRLDAFPKVETIIMPSGGFWGGVGEPTICVASPAVLNAIHAATGQPVRTLPLKNVKLRA